MVVNILSQLRHDMRVYWYGLRLQMRSAMSLRAAFIMQSVGTLVNDAGFFAAWILLFHSFGAINGWRAQEFVGLTGINMALWGIVVLLSVGIMDLPRHVDRGSLDALLTRPEPLLLQLASSNIDPTAFADVLLGVGMAGWYIISIHPGLVQLAFFAVLLLVSVIVQWCFAILLPNILAFYLFDSERLSRYASRLILDSSSYPTGVLGGGLKIMLLTLLPGLLVGAVPVAALRRPSWHVTVLAVVVAAAWLAIGLLLFRHALRRYESSNLMGAR